jgi:hypothetical protein
MLMGHGKWGDTYGYATRFAPVTRVSCLKSVLKAKCPYDARTGQRKGKLRIIGRVAGQLIETMYALLKTDAEIVSRVLPNEAAPEPVLYDPEKHRQHREGHYQPLKVSVRRSPLPLFPHSSP